MANKKFDVFGMGNALVDMEFKVGDDILKSLEVDKGLMTLIDDQRHSSLMSALPMDLMMKKCCGGSAANTINAIADLGGEAFYSCKVASDETGDFYLKDLTGNGVKTNLTASKRQEGVTGKCIVMVTPDAQRSMSTYLGITQNYSEEELDFDALRDSEYLYIEGYLVTSPTGMAAAIKAREFAQKNDIKVALTFSDPAMVTYFKEGMMEIIGDKIDLIFANEEEALAFSGAKDLEAAALEMKRFGHTIAITKGKKGAEVHTADQKVSVEAPEVSAVDSNGAGDLFAGSFLYGITQGHDLEKSAGLACNTAAHLVTQFGARLQKDQLLEVKASVL